MLTRIALTCTLPVLSLWSAGITGSHYTLSLKYKNVHGENGEEGDQWRQVTEEVDMSKVQWYTCMKTSLWNPLFCMQKKFVKNNFFKKFSWLFHSFVHVPKLQYKKKH